MVLTAMKKKTYAQLEREVLELKAQMANTYAAASKRLSKCENLIGSGVILRLEALGGKEIIPPVYIVDGLSEAAINALRNEVIRSYNEVTYIKP